MAEINSLPPETSSQSWLLCVDSGVVHCLVELCVPHVLLGLLLTALCNKRFYSPRPSDENWGLVR